MSFFSNLFGKSTRTGIAADLSALKCDIHSHFIPGIDDGAQTMEDSIFMLGEFYKMGYKKVITTPHVMSDSYRNTPEHILNGLGQLKAALKNAGILLEIDAAAEYYLDFEFEKMIEQKQLLTFGKASSNYLLFEISFINPPDNLFAVIFKLITNGYRPVLAHPERYNFWHLDFKKYEELIEKGVLFQLNINSLAGHYGLPTKRIAERMIDQNMISFLGSDCHHAGHIEIMKKTLYENTLHKMMGSGKLLNASL